jgi:hypothetical protein
MTRLLNNWNLKLISLGLAFLLWTHVRGEVNPLETLTVDAPLRVDVPAGWKVTNAAKLPSRVTVTLSGPRVSLRQIRGVVSANPLVGADTPLESSSLNASLPIRIARVGEQEVALNAATDAPHVEVLGVKPASLSVVLARK